jgi:hypothetical protein
VRLQRDVDQERLINAAFGWGTEFHLLLALGVRVGSPFWRVLCGPSTSFAVKCWFF